jgi:hypothetical protein
MLPAEVVSEFEIETYVLSDTVPHNAQLGGGILPECLGTV